MSTRNYLGQHQILHQDDSILDKLAAAHHEYTKKGHNDKGPDQQVIRNRIIQKIITLLEESYRRHDHQQHHDPGDENRSGPFEKPTGCHKSSTTTTATTTSSSSSKDTAAMARVLEAHLFRTAATWDEYQDESTLAKRLQYVVHHCKRRRSAWQSERADGELRRRMIARVKHLIVHRLPPRKSQDKAYVATVVPRMAQRVEQAMYRGARTREEYADEETITYRLHGLALEYNTQYHFTPSI